MAFQHEQQTTGRQNKSETGLCGDVKTVRFQTFVHPIGHKERRKKEAGFTSCMPGGGGAAAAVATVRRSNAAIASPYAPRRPAIASRRRCLGGSWIQVHTPPFWPGTVGKFLDPLNF